MKLAILGANSHIAKGLICNFLKSSENSLFLFTRSSAKTTKFVKTIKNISTSGCTIKEGYKDFLDERYDAVINCIGAGTPSKLGNDFSVWFSLTEEYDNICLNYLRRHPETIYINFSSGAVYGRSGQKPATETSEFKIKVNKIEPEDFYSIARLNSEAKHRSLADMHIADIRIFSYFSRFIDLNSGYFITELINCLLSGKTFITNNVNIVRDYIHPTDLHKLITRCIRLRDINAAFDAVSRAPVEKFQIIDFFAGNYGLKYTVSESPVIQSPNGINRVYCSDYNCASEIGYSPDFSAMEALKHEAGLILSKNI